ncbi:hypothetical protein IWW55_001590, partial [Coemansia sp. RSA 2706]
EPELAHHIGAIQPAAVSTSIIADSATIDAVAAASDHQVTECATKRTTLWDLLKEWPILACCIATITTSGVEGALEPALPIYMRDKFGSGPVVISLVFISYFVPDIVVSPIAGKYTSSQRVLDRLAPFGRFTFIIVASVLLAVAVACLGVTTSIAGLVVNLVFGGMLGGVAVVPILSIMGEHVERMGGDAYAKVYALFNIAFSVGVIIVPTIVPPIMSAIGFAATMGVISAILVLGAIILAVHPTPIADVYTGESLGWAMGIAFSGCTLRKLGEPVLGGANYEAVGVHAIAKFVGVITTVDYLFLLLIETSQSKLASLSRIGSSNDLRLCLREKPSATGSISVLIRHAKDATTSQAIMPPSAPNVSPGADYAADSILTGDAEADMASMYSDMEMLSAKPTLPIYMRNKYDSSTDILNVIIMLILSTMGEQTERIGGDAVSSIIVPTTMPPIMNAVGFAATMDIIASIIVAGAIILAILPSTVLSKHSRATYAGENALSFLQLIPV